MRPLACLIIALAASKASAQSGFDLLRKHKLVAEKTETIRASFSIHSEANPMRGDGQIVQLTMDTVVDAVQTPDSMKTSFALYSGENGEKPTLNLKCLWVKHKGHIFVFANSHPTQSPAHNVLNINPAEKTNSRDVMRHMLFRSQVAQDDPLSSTTMPYALLENEKALKRANIDNVESLEDGV